MTSRANKNVAKPGVCILGNLLLAFQFLTRLPIPCRGEVDSRRLGASSAWFPLVGVFLGAVLASAVYGLGFVFAPPVLAALWLVISTLSTGGLHLDGLMDTADGIMGGREPSRVLEIMRDSRVGAMGVLAAVLTLLLKWTLLASWLGAGPGAARISVLVLVPTLGRWTMVGGLFFYPYARAGGGLGRPFNEGVRLPHLLTATLTALAAAWFLGGALGTAALVGAGTAAGFTAWLIARRIGGLTGDAYGAMNEVGEAAALLCLVGLERFF